jgi:RNA polymerase sigma factor (sigma-70 family)
LANGHLDSVLQHIRKLVAAEGTRTAPDRELLERFIQHRDETAFTALVQRHGPMVLSVCRRVLGHAEDAEDACQATFLVLARKAASIRKKESLGSWLHGVAYRAAANLKREVSRRTAHEVPAVDVPPVEPTDITWREVRTVLDEELRGLPERFRAPLLLCYLEGKTRDEAARELGWSLGTIRGRLERGRELLRTRLIRRGLTLSAVLLASMLAENAVAITLPATLVVRTVKAAASIAAGQTTATGIISTRVIALMEGGLKAMWMTKLKLAIATWAALSLVGVGAGVLAKGMLAAQAPAVASAASGQVAPYDADKRKASDGPPVADGKREQPSDALQLARNQAESRLNLKMLALAMHNYQDTYAHFPAPAIYRDLYSDKSTEPPQSGATGGPPGPTVPRGLGSAGRRGLVYGPGRPGGPGMPGGPSRMGRGPTPAETAPFVIGKDSKALLSWRVEILPFLGEAEGELYKQFHLDEPWDSPHNKKLLPRMPRVYAPPGATAREPYSTFYQVFVGPHAAFEQHLGMRVPADFTDGMSQTLLIVEAGSAVPWTKPEDLPFAADPLPELGGLFPSLFNAAFADGSVWPLSKKLDADTLRRLIQRDDGQPVDLYRLRLSPSSREVALRQQNERLKQEVERERTRLEELRREEEILKEMSEDPGTQLLKQENARLEQENARLEQLLRQSREEADRLKQEIQRLKRSLGKRAEEREKR